MDLTAVPTLTISLPKLRTILTVQAQKFLLKSAIGESMYAKSLLTGYLNHICDDEDVVATLFGSPDSQKKSIPAVTVVQPGNHTKINLYSDGASTLTAPPSTATTHMENLPVNAPATGGIPRILSGYSSVRALSAASRKTFMQSLKIVPLTDNKSTALAVLNSPEATEHINNFNHDLKFENEKVLHMNNTLQKYIPAEDEMISSGLGLIAAAKLKGAIPFREFKTTFSATSFLRGYYNYDEGDIYQFSIFTVRVDVA
ncbi:hypothetical protein TrLO_g2011 [Triparma laevis f. longispina]|uniref:Uncharacterized protein n=1 Tax=Triparma laevis f. longispina TaxID=1714387 RepID=A0A9W6ZGI7_9STRA|nr:hypothetical protein TrLO_g2011 [Triparma laevis f. longispina]